MKSEIANWVEKDGVIWNELDPITQKKMIKQFLSEKGVDQMGFVGRRRMT